MKYLFSPIILLAFCLTPTISAAVDITDDFSSNPLAAGSPWSVSNFAIPSTSASGSSDTSMPAYPDYTNQFIWNARRACPPV